MPQRLLRPGIRQSKRWNRLPYFEQVFYIRLLTLVDDYGRYEADPELLRSEAFPFGDPEGNVIQMTAIDSSLLSFDSKNMILLYERHGKKYLQITRWKERARTESRFPAPEKGAEKPPEKDVLLTNDSKCQQMIASPPSPSPSPSPAPHDSKCQQSQNAERPSWKEVKEYASGIHCGLTEWKARDWFDEMQGCGWLDFQHRPIMDWKAVLRRVKTKWEADGRPTAPFTKTVTNQARPMTVDEFRIMEAKQIAAAR